MDEPECHNRSAESSTLCSLFEGSQSDSSLVACVFTTITSRKLAENSKEWLHEEAFFPFFSLHSGAGPGLNRSSCESSSNSSAA